MKNKDTETKKALYWLLDLGINIVIIFGLVIIIQTWIMAPFDVSGGSMCDTLNYLDNVCVGGYGEKIIINEALYLVGEPERGDIVVFNVNKEDEEDMFYIKRIIGLPGETVRINEGDVYVKKIESKDYTMIEETYLNESNKGNTKTYFNNFSTFVVPNDHYFVLGDNRKASTDSRSCFMHSLSNECAENPELAYIDLKQIRGKASLVWWPLSSFRVIHNYMYSELN